MSGAGSSIAKSSLSSRLGAGAAILTGLMLLPPARTARQSLPHAKSHRIKSHRIRTYRNRTFI